MKLSNQEIELAKDWLADCFFEDIFDKNEIYQMENKEIQEAIKKHYNGGIKAFVDSVQGF